MKYHLTGIVIACMGFLSVEGLAPNFLTLFALGWCLGLHLRGLEESLTR